MAVAALLRRSPVSGGCIHRAFVSRVNTNETLVFLNTWFSHPKDLVFCALTKAIHKDLEENQVFQVRGFFKLGFCLVLEKQAIVWFSAGCLHLLQLTKWKYYYISFNICVEYSKEDLQTQRLHIDCSRKSVI